MHDPTRRERVVLGLDIGGTWTRALLATTTGQRLGSGRSAGANPTTHGTTAAVERIASAVRDALDTSDPTAVAGCVIGLAGASRYTADPATVEAFEQVWRTVGITCPVQVTSDVAIAYAAGTPRPTGSVLLAGTGAIAAEIRDWEPVAIHGGYGWLLGDDGSGYWMGRQAVRATLAALDGRAPMSALPKLILDWYLGVSATARQADGEGTGRAPAHAPHLDAGTRLPKPRPVAALISEVNRRPPVSLADVAPLVVQAHEEGDPAAARILDEAAGLLVENLEPIGPRMSDAPVVLAGGLLTSAYPVRDLVVSAIQERWPGADVRTARDGDAAAAWLAAAPLLAAAEADALHARLMPPPAAG